MSLAVKRLQALLSGALECRVASQPVPKALTKVIADLEKSLGNPGADRPHRDRVIEAVVDFRRTLELKPFSRARLVCFGICEPVSNARDLLIDDERLFARTLELLKAYSERPHLYRRCYFGLLTNYFKYDPESDLATVAGQSNWRMLRSYLSNGMKLLLGPGEEREWVSVLRNHANLLTDNPLDRYGREALKGESRELKSVREGLGIEDTSWVFSRLVNAAISAVVAETDNGFIGHLQSALRLLAQKTFYQREGVARLVNRYAEMNQTPVHADLRDAALDVFGSPWVDSRNSAWGRVTKEGRTMIRQWVSLKLMTHFFEILSGDPNTDHRRLEFWRGYHKQVGVIYIALGRRANASRSPDMNQLRMLVGDHKLDLVGEAAGNNAFLMRMGNVYALEFGMKGSACFIFRAKDLPFEPKGAVRLDRSVLREASVARLTHNDMMAGTWEQQFSEELKRLGLVADDKMGRPARRSQRKADGEGGAASYDASRYSWAALAAFADIHGLSLRDMTPQGGRVWVSGASRTGPIASQLTAWGFTWAEARGAWYRG
jgi:hypothetical protein